jgi:hypothetical protein
VLILLVFGSLGLNSIPVMPSSGTSEGPAAATEYVPPALTPYGAPVGTIPAEPPEFAARPRLPLCGAEAPASVSVDRDLPARRCLLRSWQDGTPAEFVATNPSIEGPYLVIYRVVDENTVEELSNDSPWGQGPIRKVCKELEVSLEPAPRRADPLQPTGIRVSDCHRAELWG